VIRVLLADDHAVVRQGLRTYLELQEDIEVAGEAADGEAAIAAAGRLAPDVVLLDWRCRGATAWPRCRGCLEAAPGVRVLVLTSFGEDDRLFAALRAGAVRVPLKGHRAGRARAARSAPPRRASPALAGRSRSRDRAARPRGAPERGRDAHARASARCSG
jgi:DNA-binding NarL/FixJ family response regulator